MTPRWAKLRDAAKYASIGHKRLIALAESGIIKGFKDPDSGRSDWIFDILSIDAYRESQYGGQRVTPNQIAVDILRSVGAR